MPDRRPYRREAEDKRRDDLIAAALDLVAEGGPQAATVRAIAGRAGVSPGLIRHYFASKDDLTREAYRHLMTRMIHQAEEAAASSAVDPVGRLSAFVSSSLRPPVVDSVAVGVWAGFLYETRRDPSLRDVHSATYLGFRDVLQGLIADLPRNATSEHLRADAIAYNAVIDGLWLEASMLPESFAPGEIERIGLASVGALLGIDLLAAKRNISA